MGRWMGLWAIGIAGMILATADARAQAEVPLFVDLPQIISNLNHDGPRQRFILLNLSLEIGAQEDQAAIENELPRIQDLLIAYLRDVQLDDLEGSAGIYDLREQVLHRIRLAVRPIDVHGVLFREVLIQ